MQYQLDAIGAMPLKGAQRFKHERYFVSYHWLPTYFDSFHNQISFQTLAIETQLLNPFPGVKHLRPLSPPCWPLVCTIWLGLAQGKLSHKAYHR